MKLAGKMMGLLAEGDEEVARVADGWPVTVHAGAATGTTERGPATRMQRVDSTIA